MSRIISFLKDESGAAAAEYALILAVVTAAIATAATTLGSNVANAITKAANTVAGA